MRRLVVASLAFLVALPLCASTNDAGWRADIQFLTTELPKRHKNAFFHVSKAAFESASADLVAAVPSLIDSEVVVRIFQLVAMIGDAHTSVGGVAFATYPFAVYWFDDGLYVTRASREQADLFASRVTAVDGHPVDEVLAAVGTVFAHENDSWLRSVAPSYVVAGAVLHALKITSDPHLATFTFARGDGSTFDRTLQTAGMVDPVEAPLTLARRNAGLNYWAEYLPAQRAVYLRYNRCRNDPAKPFATFLNEFWISVGERPVERLVIDLRDNPGGDSNVLQPLISGIQSMPSLNRADRLFVLINRGTFSSAMLNALDLDTRTNATLAGEPTGGKPNAYGEVTSFGLPSSRLTIFYSTKFFELLPGDDPPSVAPNVTVPVVAGAYFAGVDPVVDLVLPPVVKRRPSRH